MRGRAFGGGRLLRIVILLAVFSIGRRLFRGTDLGGGVVTPGSDTTLVLVALAAGVVVIGGALAFRAGMVPFGNSKSGFAADSGEDYVCRYCGENLERYRNRCPRCETRDPVSYPEDQR